MIICSSIRLLRVWLPWSFECLILEKVALQYKLLVLSIGRDMDGQYPRLLGLLASQ